MLLLLVVSSQGGCGLIIDGFQIKSMNPHVGRTVTVLLPDLHDTFPGRHGAVTLGRPEKLTPLRPATLTFLFISPPLSSLCPAEAKQMQSRNKETIHRRSQSCPSVLTVGRRRTKQAGPRLTKRLIFRDGVNKDNYDALITALIPAGAAVPVNGPGRRGSTQVVSRDPWEPALTPSCPHLGETVILSARRKRKRKKKEGGGKEKVPTAQLPRVFTAAPHQTFIKCHLYSV